MNALLHDRAERAGPGEGYDRAGTSNAGDEDHVLAALYGDEAEPDAAGDAELPVQPTVRGASTSQNADDVLRFDPVDRPVTRGRMARNARR